MKATRKASTRNQHATPRVGSKFSITYKGKELTLEVVKADNETGVAYKLGAKTFDHPNKAEGHVVGRPTASHGFKFWGIEGGATKKPAAAAKATKAAKKAASK